MAKWQFTRTGTFVYPSLGFTATTGDVLDAVSAPDAWWESVDPSTPATIGVVPPDTGYTEPVDGSVPLWNTNTNRHVDTNLDTAIAARVEDTESATAAALSATYARRFTAFDGVKARLDAGYSTAISYMTDSTGNDAATEHIGLTAAAIGAMYPNYRVIFRGYDNGAANNYSLAPVQIQAGVGGDRKVTFNGSTAACLMVEASSVNSITGDLDVRAKIAATDWDAAGARTIAAKYGNSGSRAWWWNLDGPNMILYYTVDGATQIGKSIALSNFTLVDGTATWVRFTLDVDNGASGHDLKWYQSSDGVTWTQKGTTNTTAGAITLFTDTTTRLNVGARSDGSASLWNGSIYEVQVRKGIDGEIVAPTLLDLWTPNPSTYNGVFTGAPILEVWAGAASAWGLNNFTTNAARMIPAAGQSMHLLGTSHNDSLRIDAGMWALWAGLLDTASARAPMAALGVFSENPQKSPRSALEIDLHKQRCIGIPAFAQARGIQSFPVYEAFIADDDLANTVQSDGIHPTATGSQLWAAVMLAGFNLA